MFPAALKTAIPFTSATALAILAALHFLRRDVGPWHHRFISEYACCIPGSPSNRFRHGMTFVFVLSAMLCSFETMHLWKNGHLPQALLLLVTAVSCVVMAFFPTDLNVHRDTLPITPAINDCRKLREAGRVHDLSALIGFTSAACACLWVSVVRGSPAEIALTTAADIGMVLQFGIITAQRRRAECAPYRWVGLWERVAIGGFLFWCIVMTSTSAPAP
jgi:hypothetical protein